MANTTKLLIADQAEKAFRAGNFSEAADLYKQAAEVNMAHEDAPQAAENMNNRSVALLQAGDAAGALQAAQGTEQVFAQAGDLRRQGLALGNQAAALDALGRLDEALERYRQSSDLLKQVGDKESRAVVLKSISVLQIRTGKHLEAVATMDAALDNQPKPSFKERLLKKLLDIPFKIMGRG